MASLFSPDNPKEGSGAARDIVALGVALTFLLLFLQLSDAYFVLGRQLAEFGSHNGNIIVGLLLLNVALTIYGWRRYRDASREVVERTAAERRAQSLASTDPLTGFLNRRSYGQEAADLIAAAGRRKKAVAMLVVDIDGFKTVNDVHGHLTGDNLLRMAAEVIQKAMPRGSVTARLGGDEFGAAFIYDPSAPSEADRVADFIVDRLGKPFDLAGVHTHVSASVGLASTADGCESVELLTRRADIAMQAAKKLGRSRFVWFDASMQRELERRNEIEQGLRRGVPAGEFVPYYEQQIDLVTGSLHGFEMLARWNHPERGLVPPDEFLTLIEREGLGIRLDQAVLHVALEQLGRWDHQGLRLDGLSVNLGLSSMCDPDLPRWVADITASHRIHPDRLRLEITEHDELPEEDRIRAGLAHLVDAGFALSLDDFGVGYSSLSYLQRYPISLLKLDRSLVDHDDPASQPLITAIAGLGRSLGLDLLAEGIETAAQRDALRRVGVRFGQGYFFARPLPALEFAEYCRARAEVPTQAGAPVG
jgi:diguanylate cyclase (GGDEF)-like protein